MKDSTVLLIGGALGAYFLFIKPTQEAVKGAIELPGQIYGGFTQLPGQALETLLQPIQQFFNSFMQPGQQAPLMAPQQPNAEIARAKAVTTWQATGGTVKGQAFILPKPLGQAYGLTVQQPAITNLMQAIGSGQSLSTVTTLADVMNVQRTRAREAEIKQGFPQGSRVIGHRVQSGQDIYTVKSPSGAISIVRD